ncbi:MAG: hypothetical protein K1X57_01310 [Gemmataceae bacterium]|nr:hypothetical protein [Gemmataceae bacterium]
MNPKQIDLIWLIVFGCLSSAICVATSREIGATYDEPIYLKNGLHYWRTGSHRELMKLGTMPLPVDTQTLPLGVTEWWRGERFDEVAQFPQLLVWMRHGNLVFWWLLLWSAMRFARDLGGDWAGRLAVAALACEPNLLAHAALATTDIAIAATLSTFLVAYRRGHGLDYRWRVVVPGILFGIALLAKASALAFGPILMFAVEITQHSEEKWCDRIRRFLLNLIQIGMIGLLVAIVGCGSDFEPSGWFVTWAKSQADSGWKPALVWVAKHFKVFGNAIEAIATQIQHNARGHGQYLLGARDYRPFWWYFPTIILIKLPIPILAAAGWLALTRPKAWLGNTALLGATLLLVFSLNCRVQLGIRMQLPLVVMLITGLAVLVAQAGIRLQACAVAGVAGLLWVAGTTWPHHLMYSNRLWGGPLQTYLVAGDSNSDWGQGLPELDRWHASAGRPGLDIWYFGQDPALKQFPARDLPLHNVNLQSPDDMPQFVWGRTLAVSTNISHGYRLSPSHAHALEYIQRRQPIARTPTFLIYSFADVPAPQAKP